MFESVYTVLNQFIEREDRPLWRFDIYYVETVRSENPSELFYLCNVSNRWFVVFETDFFDKDTLRAAAKEASGVFGPVGFKPLHWLKKKDPEGHGSTIPLNLHGDVQLTDLVYKVENTFLKCAVMALESRNGPTKRYDPTAYGYST